MVFFWLQPNGDDICGGRAGVVLVTATAVLGNDAYLPRDTDRLSERICRRFSCGGGMSTSRAALVANAGTIVGKVDRLKSTVTIREVEQKLPDVKWCCYCNIFMDNNSFSTPVAYLQILLGIDLLFFS
jgi:hypothetical protein